MNSSEFVSKQITGETNTLLSLDLWMLKKDVGKLKIMWEATSSTETLVLENLRSSLSFNASPRLNSNSPEFLFHMQRAISGTIRIFCLIEKSS